jgi:hypothetical protein
MKTNITRLEAPQKRPSVMTLEMTQSHHRTLFIPEGKEKYRQNLKNNGKMVIATISGFGSRLCNGKILAPLTSVLLNGNLLISLGFKSVV